MTEIQFQQVVAAYVNRPLNTFMQGSPAVNLLRVAINNAKKWAQRQMDFELARTSVLVSVDVNLGGALTSATALDGVTPVVINRIERAFLGYGQPGQPPNTLSFRPISVTSKQHAAFRQKRVWDGVGLNTSNPHPTFVAIREPALIRQGQTVYISPTSPNEQGSVVQVGLDVVAWLADYDDTNQNDFFIDQCGDWLMYRSIRELNFFLKDANRVTVTSGLVSEAWDNLVQWNGSLSTDDDNTLS